MNKNWNRKKRHAGIYLITIKGTRDDQPLNYYIGQSVSVMDRWNTHLTQLFAGTHHNKKLQELFNNNNYRDLNFTILKLCKKTELDKYERDFIKQYISDGKNILNISLVDKE